MIRAYEQTLLFGSTSAIMTRSNVCRSLVSRISKQVSEEAVSTWHQYGGTQAAQDHSVCCSAFCVANDVRYRLDNVRHVHEGCNCSLAGFDWRVLECVIRQGHVPLVRMEGGDGETRINTELLRPDTILVAISCASVSKSLINVGSSLIAAVCQTVYSTWGHRRYLNARSNIYLNACS